MKNKSIRYLDLSMIEPVCRPAAREAFEANDGTGFADSGYSRGATLAIVAVNRLPLQKHGIYETALIAGYCGSKRNHHEWPTDRLKALFDQADRERLLAAGDPLPTATGSFTIYRGVYGGQPRRVRGFSWTLDLAVAAWFACAGEDPAIYSASVQPHEIYCYRSGRDEHEIIAFPARPTRMQLSVAELERLVAQLLDRRKQDNEAWIAGMKQKMQGSPS